jgi:hypothetical protein
MLNMTGFRPAVGSRYEVLKDHTLRLAVAEQTLVSLPRGTTLRIESLDESWDNGHALIASFCQIEASLRVLDGPSAGEIVEVVITGTVMRLHDQPEESYSLPDWLAPA